MNCWCRRFPPTIVACFCIHLACKWSNYKIPLSAHNKEWFVYMDPTVTSELLEQLTEEFLSIYEQCPSRLKRKIKASTEMVRILYALFVPNPMNVSFFNRVSTIGSKIHLGRQAKLDYFNGLRKRNYFLSLRRFYKIRANMNVVYCLKRFEVPKQESCLD